MKHTSQPLDVLVSTSRRLEDKLPVLDLLQIICRQLLFPLLTSEQQAEATGLLHKMKDERGPLSVGFSVESNPSSHKTVFTIAISSGEPAE